MQFSPKTTKAGSRLALTLLPATLALCCQVSPAQAVELTPFGPCAGPGQAGKFPATAQCANLTVLEDSAKPAGRRLQLPLVKIPTTSKTPGAPVFVLNGGPGSPNLHSNLPTGQIARDRDVYYLGYRGADGPVVLDCPEIDELVAAPDLLSAGSLHNLEVAGGVCAQRLEQGGYDLARYSMFGVIDDLEAARAALGAEKINLLSVSYGTRVAQFYARAHPGVIQRSVMAGANPPGHFVFSAHVNDQVLARLAELCRDDQACASRTPDLRASLLKAVRLGEASAAGGVDDGKSRLGLFVSLYSRAGALAFIDAALAAENGDTQALKAFGDGGAEGLKGVIWGDILAKGALDGYRYDSLEKSFGASAASMGSPLDMLFQAVMKRWPRHEPPPAYRRGAYDETETLVLNGDLDVATPLVFVQAELMPYLPNGQLVVFKDYGHSDFARQEPAVGDMIARYYRTGEVDRSTILPDPYRFGR